MEERRQVPVRGNGFGYLQQGAILFNCRNSFGLIGRHFTPQFELSIVTGMGSSSGEFTSPYGGVRPPLHRGQRVGLNHIA